MKRIEIDEKTVKLIPDEGKILVDKRNLREYSEVVCEIKQEKYFIEKSKD